jgi:RES domain-containing protein
MTGRTYRVGLPVVALQRKRFWRCLPKQYVRTVLEAGPSFTRGRRYSVRGEFGALYFSASKESSLSEVTSRAGQDSEVISCVEFEITVDRLLDLTRPATRAALRVQLDDLILPRISADAYEVPQRIARQVYREGLNGLLAPSVHDPKGERGNWFNLVLYPANLIRGSISELRFEEVTLPAR